MQKIPQEHIDALLESEKQEAMGNITYVTHKELKEHIEGIFGDFDEVQQNLTSNKKVKYN